MGGGSGVGLRESFVMTGKKWVRRSAQGRDDRWFELYDRLFDVCDRNYCKHIHNRFRRVSSCSLCKLQFQLNDIH